MVEPHFPHHGKPLFPEKNDRLAFDVLVCTILLMLVDVVSYSPH